MYRSRQATDRGGFLAVPLSAKTLVLVLVGWLLLTPLWIVVGDRRRRRRMRKVGEEAARGVRERQFRDASIARREAGQLAEVDADADALLRASASSEAWRRAGGDPLVYWQQVGEEERRELCPICGERVHADGCSEAAAPH